MGRFWNFKIKPISEEFGNSGGNNLLWVLKIHFCFSDSGEVRNKIHPSGR